MCKQITEIPFALQRYFGLCIFLGCFIFFSPISPAHANDQDAEEKPHLFVWTGGSKFFQNVKINGVLLDKEGFFSDTEVTTLPDGGYFLFLTKGSDVVPHEELRKQFKIRDDELAAVITKGHSVRSVRKVKKVALGMKPVRTFTQHVILLDLKQMDARYRQDCIREIIFLRVVDRPTKRLISDCKLKQP